jgi:hypothetical protein
VALAPPRLSYVARGTAVSAVAATDLAHHCFVARKIPADYVGFPVGMWSRVVVSATRHAADVLASLDALALIDFGRQIINQGGCGCGRREGTGVVFERRELVQCRTWYQGTS